MKNIKYGLNTKEKMHWVDMLIYVFVYLPMVGFGVFIVGGILYEGNQFKIISVVSVFLVIFYFYDISLKRSFKNSGLVIISGASFVLNIALFLVIFFMFNVLEKNGFWLNLILSLILTFIMFTIATFSIDKQWRMMCKEIEEKEKYNILLNELSECKQSNSFLKESYGRNLYEFGMMYFEGEEIEINKKESAFLIKEAIENGNVKAKAYWEKNELWKYLE